LNSLKKLIKENKKTRFSILSIILFPTLLLSMSSNLSSALTLDPVVDSSCSQFQKNYFELYNAIKREPSKVLTMASALHDAAISFLNCNAEKNGKQVGDRERLNIRKDLAGNTALLYYHYLLVAEEAAVKAKLLSLTDYEGDQVYFLASENPDFKKLFSFIPTTNPVEFELLYLKFLEEIISSLESDSFGWFDGFLTEAKTLPGSTIVTYKKYENFKQFLLEKFFKYLKINQQSLSDLQQNSILLNSAMTMPFLIGKMEESRTSRGDSMPFLSEADYSKALIETAKELGKQGNYLKAMQTLSLWLSSFEHKSRYRGLVGIVKEDLKNYAYLEDASVGEGLVQCFEGLASIEGIAVGVVLLLAPEVVATSAVIVFAGLMLGHSFQPFTDEYYGVESAASEKTVAACNLAFATIGAKHGFSKVKTVTETPLKTPFYDSIKKIRELQPQTANFGFGTFRASVKAPALKRLDAVVKSFGERIQKSLCFISLEKTESRKAMQSQLFLAFPEPCIFREIPVSKLPKETRILEESELLKLQEKGGSFVIDLNKLTSIRGEIRETPRPVAVRIIQLVEEKEGLFYEVEEVGRPNRFKIKKDVFDKYANYLKFEASREIFENAIVKAEIALRKSAGEIFTERSVSAEDGFLYIEKGEIFRIGKVSAAEEKAVYVGLGYETTGSSGGQVPILKSGDYKGGYRGGYGATFEFDLMIKDWLDKYDAVLEFLPKKVPVYDLNGNFLYFKEVRNDPWVRVTKENKEQLQFMIKYANALRKYKADLLSRLEKEGKTLEEINVELDKLRREVGVDHLTVQVVVKNKVPLTEVKRIRVDTEELRILYINELKKTGINFLKNRPVEEAVVVEFR